MKNALSILKNKKFIIPAVATAIIVTGIILVRKSAPATEVIEAILDEA